MAAGGLSMAAPGVDAVRFALSELRHESAEGWRVDWEMTAGASTIVDRLTALG